MDDNKKTPASPMPPDGSIPSPFSSKKSEKVDWVKVVAESNGTRVFVPDEIKKEMVEIERRRETYNASLEKIAEGEVTLMMDSQNAYFAIRKYLSKKGIAVWLKEIGLDPQALKDGEYVINLRDKG